jgi:hypothetical protein
MTDESKAPETFCKPSLKELIEMLDEMNSNIEKLPPYALSMPVSNMDLSALLILLSALFKSVLDCK